MSSTQRCADVRPAERAGARRWAGGAVRPARQLQVAASLALGGGGSGGNDEFRSPAHRTRRG